MEEEMQRGGIKKRRKKNSPYNKRTVNQRRRAQARKSRQLRRLAEKGPSRRMYGGEEEMQRGGPRGRGRRAGRPKMKKARRRIFKKGCKGGGCAAYD